MSNDTVSNKDVEVRATDDQAKLILADAPAISIGTEAATEIQFDPANRLNFFISPITLSLRCPMVDNDNKETGESVTVVTTIGAKPEDATHVLIAHHFDPDNIGTEIKDAPILLRCELVGETTNGGKVIHPGVTEYFVLSRAIAAMIELFAGFFKASVHTHLPADYSQMSARPSYPYPQPQLYPQPQHPFYPHTQSGFSNAPKSTATVDMKSIDICEVVEVLQHSIQTGNRRRPLQQKEREYYTVMYSSHFGDLYSMVIPK